LWRLPCGPEKGFKVSEVGDSVKVYSMAGEDEVYSVKYPMRINKLFETRFLLGLRQMSLPKNKHLVHIVGVVNIHGSSERGTLDATYHGF